MNNDDLIHIAKTIERDIDKCGAIKRVVPRLGRTPILVLLHDGTIHREPEHWCAMDGPDLASLVRRQSMVPDEVEIVVVDLDQGNEDWASGDFYDPRLELPDDPADETPIGHETPTVRAPNGKTYRLPARGN